jgi:DNA-binding CsgD family transcriptional regulator
MADGPKRPNRPIRPRQGAPPGGRKRRVVIDTGAARPRQDNRQRRDLVDTRPKDKTPVAPPTGPVTVESGITVKDLSQALGITVPKLITFLMGLGAPKTVTQSLSDEEIELIAARLLIKLDRAEDALAFLDVSDDHARTVGTPLSRRIVSRVLRALAEDRLGRRSRSLAILSTALGLAGPQKFSRILLDEGPAFRSLAEGMAGEGHVETILGERTRRLLGARRPDERTAREPADFALSGRERQILDLLAEGLTNKEIGRRIGVDPNTVKYHLKRLFAKLSVERRLTAVTRARNYGLIA